MKTARTMDELKIDVAHTIHEARVKKGMTQKVLAKKIGTLQPSIARLERGNIMPSNTMLLKVAKALGGGVQAPKIIFD